MVDALCGDFDTCDCGAYERFGDFDAAQCRAKFEAELEAAREFGGAYDGECANRWVEILEDLGCARFEDLPDVAAMWALAGCKIYQGRESDSEACELAGNVFGGSCPPSQRCAAGADGDAFRTRCVPIRGRDEGASCEAGRGIDWSECAEGLACLDQGSQAGVCSPPGDVDTPCENDGYCRDPLVCNRVSDRCDTPVALGGSCSADRPCERTAYCHLDGDCRVLPGLGERCVLDANGSRCGPELDCGVDLDCWDAQPTVCEMAERL